MKENNDYKDKESVPNSSILLWCPKCNNLYQNDLIATKDDGIQYCPICIGSYNTLVELDEWLAEIIVKLNQLGYTTYSCCQGHKIDERNGCNNSYIMFLYDYDITFSILKERFNNLSITVEKRTVKDDNYPNGVERKVSEIRSNLSITSLYSIYNFIKDMEEFVRLLTIKGVQDY